METDRLLAVGHKNHSRYPREVQVNSQIVECLLDEIASRIDLFDQHCAEVEYTDTDAAWELLAWIRKEIGSVSTESVESKTTTKEG